MKIGKNAQSAQRNVIIIVRIYFFFIILTRVKRVFNANESKLE